MSHILETRVAETTTSTGTGDITLGGALTAHRAFADVCGTGDTTEYVIYAVDTAGAPTGDWEEGKGTYSAANTLTRTTVTRSSNANSPVNFSAGTKVVILTPLGSRVGVVPTGGTAGQVLTKNGTNDFDVAWSTSGAGERRHAFSAPYSYNGTAAAGTADSASGWTIARIAVAADGTTTVATATGAWTDRASLTYA